MQQIVTITSQGQITVPAAFRRLLGIDQYRKASVRTEDNKIVIEPIPELMSLAGSLQNKAIKDKTIEEVIKLEEEAIGEMISPNYQTKKWKNSLLILMSF